MIDDFLSSRPSFDQFIHFFRAFKHYRGEHDDALVKRMKHPLPMDVPQHDLFMGPAGDELEALMNEELPDERRQFFSHIAERSWCTTNLHISEQDRRDGYVSVDEFIEEVRVGREAYRQQFGV
jgi:hypothetical protein